MYKKVRKTSRGLIALFIITAVILLLFAAAFLLFGFYAKPTGDAELNSFLGVIKYHGVGILKLFLFNYANSSNIAYFALSVFLYAFMVIWLIFFIAALIVSNRKDRRIVWWSIFMTFIVLLVYLVFASGSQKYWQIINDREPFKDHTELKLITYAIILLGGMYSVCAICTYIWSLYESFANPRIDTDENGKLVENKANDYEAIRKIIREELEKMQPFEVMVMNPQQPTIIIHKKKAQVEEPAPQPEPEPEPVFEEEPLPEPEPVKEEPKEEPKPELVPTVKFWDAAREVFDGLDHPKPLPKEEPKPVVIAQPVEEPEQGEDEEGWNRNKRQPFLTRIITADLDIKANYNELKNEILSYGVKARLSRGGETFRLRDKKYMKIYLVGKTLKVYLALNPEDYKDSTIPVEDVGFRPNYAEMPLLFKVRSGLSVRRCKELIKAACEKDGLTQGEVKDTNWVSELRVLNAEKAKENK